ncbi:hypothetical protein [Klebsiella quasipneumoniae]|uniref:hypothetical protein n=1 Tax=Klebsiella quasipneumoniae TaxID=1463165 RepID=UPI003F6E28BC
MKAENFCDLHKAVTENKYRMGIAQPNGNSFRLNGGKRQRQTTSGGRWFAVTFAPERL